MSRKIPEAGKRLGLDISLTKEAIIEAYEDLITFDIYVDPTEESVLERWVSEYRTNKKFQRYINAITKRLLQENKKRKRVTAKKRGKYAVHCSIYQLRKKKRKRIRRRIRRKII